jgi:hypothetical protein
LGESRLLYPLISSSSINLLDLSHVTGATPPHVTISISSMLICRLCNNCTIHENVNGHGRIVLPVAQGAVKVIYFT